MTLVPVVRDMVDYLVAAEVGTFGNVTKLKTPIFIGSMPEEPNDCITLYDTPGAAPNPKFLLDEPRFLIRTRSASYEKGYGKAEEAKLALLGKPSNTHKGIRYVGIWVVTDTYFLKADDRGRSIFVSTWRVIRETNQTAGHRIPL